MYILPSSLHASHVGLLILFFSFQTNISALQIRSPPISRANHEDCKEVLTKNLECPSIGSYAVAGACEYFARCFQTQNGVEVMAEWCPSNHIYMINRCIKSQKTDVCPQRSCPIESDFKIIVPTSPVHPGIKPKPGKVPILLPNLHPTIHSNACCIAQTQYGFTFLLCTLPLIINRVN